MTAVTTVVVVALFWALAAMLPMGFMTPEYAMWRARKDMIEHCQLAPVIVQGDSRAAAGLLPSRLGRPGEVVNLALGGATPVETFYAMEEILRCHRPPRQVVMSLSPGLFMVPVHFWERAALFQFLSFGQLEDIRRRSRAFGETIYFEPSKAGDLDAMFENALHATSFPSYYVASMVDHILVGRLSANARVRSETRSARGQHAYGTDDGSTGIADEARMDHFKPSAMLNAYMEQVLDRYSALGVRVDFVPVPINRATYDRLKPGLADDFQHYLDKLAARHPNFHVDGGALRPLDNQFFGDMTHLNARGAAEFSDSVRPLLQHAGS